ncbi:MAG: hypothetical protein WCG37_04925 [Actinomycetes bacterium]
MRSGPSTTNESTALIELLVLIEFRDRARDVISLRLSSVTH